MRIDYPAPEEVRTWPDYVALFRLRNPDADVRRDLMQAKIGTQSYREWFAWCWQQPDAEAIHKAFQ